MPLHENVSTKADHNDNKDQIQGLPTGLQQRTTNNNLPPHTKRGTSHNTLNTNTRKGVTTTTHAPTEVPPIQDHSNGAVVRHHLTPGTGTVVGTAGMMTHTGTGHRGNA